MSSSPARVQVRGPGSLIAVVPHLLGFHPTDSLVLVGVAGPHALIRFAFRYDLPDPPDAPKTGLIADHAAWILHREKLTTAAVVGYGSGRLVTPVTDVLRHRLPRGGFRLADVLRVEDGRYWSYLCAEPVCCPPEGRLLSTDDPAAVVMAESGMTAVASRDDLAATIAAGTGAEAKAMRTAMRQAARITGQELDEFGRDAMFDKLRDTVKKAIASYREGGTITDPVELARVCLALRAMEVRDDAWARMRPEHRAAHRRLWIDLTRHAMPGYLAAPASLLAFVAWQDGDGVLASLALERALADDPDYTMAQLIAQALTAALPPSLAVLPVTPEEVAALYKKPDPGE